MQSGKSIPADHYTAQNTVIETPNSWNYLYYTAQNTVIETPNSWNYLYYTAQYTVIEVLIIPLLYSTVYSY